VDMDRDGRIRRPSEITETEVSAQIGRARQAASSACLYAIRPRGFAIRRLAIELSRALVQALAEAGDTRSPEAAAAIVLQAVTKLQQQLAASDKAPRSQS